MGQKPKAAVIAALAGFALACGTASGSELPGATAFEVCAAAGPYWPTMTLAVDGASAWIACKEQSRVIRVSTKTGKTTRRGYLYRIPTGRTVAQRTGRAFVSKSPVS